LAFRNQVVGLKLVFLELALLRESAGPCRLLASHYSKIPLF